MDTPMDVPSLVRAVEQGRRFDFRFFWGNEPRADGELSDSVFSQWWACRFELDGQVFESAEQFMMASKARLFDDDSALEAILAARTPADCKALGRTVRNFDRKRWEAVRVDRVTRGNVAKFGQDGRMRAYLLGTGDAIPVEASPKDAIWGIGLAAADPRAMDPRAWQGLNLLGFALVRARAVLRGELPEPR